MIVDLQQSAAYCLHIPPPRFLLSATPTWSTPHRQQIQMLLSSLIAHGMALPPAPVKTEGLSDGKWQRTLHQPSLYWRYTWQYPLPLRQPGTNCWEIWIISRNLSVGVIKPLRGLQWRRSAGSSAERGSGADKDGWWKGLKMAGEGTHKGVSRVYEFSLWVSAKPNTHHFHKNLAV